jgi:predicted DNA-binding protein
MLAIRLDEKLERQLEELARARHSNKSEIVRRAVVRMLEDEEDIRLAESARKRTRSTKPLAQLRKELGLDR